MTDLTPNEAKALTLIREAKHEGVFVKMSGKDLTEALGFSSRASGNTILQALESKGYVRRLKGAGVVELLG